MRRTNFLLAFTFLFAGLLFISCSPTNENVVGTNLVPIEEVPQLPTGVFLGIGAPIQELRDFEAKQKDRVVTARIPDEVEKEELWVAVFSLLDSNGELASCKAIAYSGRGDCVERVNLFMQSRSVYEEMVKPWVEYTYRKIGVNGDGREVYQEKTITKPSPEDVLLLVSLVDDPDPKKEDYKLLWAKRSDLY